MPRPRRDTWPGRRPYGRLRLTEELANELGQILGTTWKQVQEDRHATPDQTPETYELLLRLRRIEEMQRLLYGMMVDARWR